MTGRIIGTGSYLPEDIVTNDDLAKIMDTSDEWISSRTGIRARHLVKDETTASLSTKAALAALKDANVSPEEIDVIIEATISGDYATPASACEVQANIGAVNAVCFDLAAACSGFMYALSVAQAYIKSGMYDTILVIGAETLSKLMDWTDRTTSVLFGDGAGAAVVRRDDVGIGAIDQHSDGSKGQFLTVPERYNNNPLVKADQLIGYCSMDGQEIYKFAVKNIPVSINRVLEAESLTPADIRFFLLHQANYRILESVSKRLKVPMDKIPVSLDHCGNLSAGSVPVLLDEVNKKGLLKRGDKLVLSGFGGGLTWGTAYIEW